jgi:hypothetical protein
VDYVSSWWTPIDVSLPTDIDPDPFATGHAYTYGLVATELAESDWPSVGFPARLVERLGLASLLATSRAVADVPTASDDVSVHAHRLREVVEHELVSLVAPIAQAADSARRFDTSPTKGVLRFAEAYGPSFRPKSLRRGERVDWAQSFTHLRERCALELFELYASRPRLRRCVYCRSVFVPTRDERSCRWNLWRWPASPGDAPLRLCAESRQEEVTKATRQPDARLVHARARKRLWARYDRARRAAIGRGEDPETNRVVIAARNALRDYVEGAGVRRGRPAVGDESNVLPVPEPDAPTRP